MKKEVIFSAIVVLLFMGNMKADSILWMSSLENAKKLSQATNKPILLDFWAHWCGPCKKMDSDVWGKEEIKVLMANFIPVKIDVDIDVKNAQKYSARGIPTLMIVDSWGGALYKSVGYKDKQFVKKLLINFSINLAGINRATQILLKKPEHVGLNMRLAQKYQDYAVVLKKDARVAFLKKSNKYLKKSKKLNKKGDKPITDERIELLRILNKSYFGNARSVLKKIDKTFKIVDKKNEGLFFFIKYYSAYQTKNHLVEDEMLKKLGSNPDYSHYYKKAQKYVRV